MMIPIYQVDTFTNKIFSGNPAAVCPLDNWLSDELLQNIAMENNLAETAFYVNEGDRYHIRWFTPTVEVDLCGHATLAAAFVLFNFEGHAISLINFYSHRSGVLTVNKLDEYLTLNFPTDVFEPVSVPEQLFSNTNITPIEAYKGKTDYMLVLENEKQIMELIPDYISISKLDGRGLIVTARGDDADFVSRFFAPQSGIDEDPVTGSAHTTLTPYWSEKLNKKDLTAIQLSNRRGYLRCSYLGDRVEICGQAKLYMAGKIYTA